MMKKRGLSDVVTTVLIILLVLAAVVIIWSFVRPAIQSGAGKVTGGCVALDLSVVSCTTAGSVVVERGADNVDLTGVVVVITDNNGDSNPYDPATAISISELGRRTIDASSVLGTNPVETAVEATVTGRIKTEAGETQLCPVAAIKVECA